MSHVKHDANSTVTFTVSTSQFASKSDNEVTQRKTLHFANILSPRTHVDKVLNVLYQHRRLMAIIESWTPQNVEWNKEFPAHSSVLIPAVARPRALKFRQRRRPDITYASTASIVRQLALSRPSPQKLSYAPAFGPAGLSIDTPSPQVK